LTTGVTLKHTPTPWWEYSLQLGLFYHNDHIDPPGVAPGVRDPVGIPPSVTDDSFTREDVTVRQLFTIAQGVQLAGGAQVQFEDGTSDGNLLVGRFTIPTSFRLSRTTWGPFFEAQLSLLPGLLVQGGVRVDLPQKFDTKASPRVRGSYTLEATRTTFRVNAGEGFKLPSFFALGYPLVGNPNLLPETSHSVDAGVSQALWDQRFAIGVTYFYSTFRNLIDFDPGPPPRVVNRSRTTAQGVEMSLRLQPWPYLSTTAHLTYLQTDIQRTTEKLRNRPKWRGGFAVQWSPRPDLDVHLHTIVVGAVPDSSIPTRARTLDAYARMDLAVNWTLTRHWQVFVAVDNLFDAAYEEFIGFLAPGVSPRAGVRASFYQGRQTMMGLWSIFATVFLAELGDKTQIATLLFAADPRLSRLGVFVASAGALALSSLIAVIIGGQLSSVLSPRLLKGIAGVGFLLLGLWTLLDLRAG